MNKIMVKEVGQASRIIEVDDKYVTECAKKFIHDYPEYVHLGNELYLFVDGEGLIKELPVNFLLEINSPYFPIQKMVGTVVFIREKPVGPGEIYDYEVDDLTELDMKLIEFITSSEKQEEQIIRKAPENNLMPGRLVLNYR